MSPSADMDYLAERARALLADGLHLSRVAARLGVSDGTIRRVLAGPAPEAGAARLGRPPVAELPARLLARVTRSAMHMSPNCSDRLRTRGAFEIVTMPGFLTGDETDDELACIALIRERLAEGRELPLAMRRQVRTMVTPEALKHMRGGNRARLEGFARHRRFVIADEFGGETRLLAMHAWTGDDMTLNYPFWYECTARGDACAERFGKRVSRAQLLVLTDIATGFIIGFLIVAKRSDGYNQRDVMALCQRAMMAHGKPLETLFERGVWKGAQITSALHYAGINPHTARLARSKPIERIFGLFQERMPGIITALGLGWEKFNLGRYADDYRDNQKIWCLLRNGKIDPEQLGIPHISEMHRVCGLVFDHLNQRRVCGRQIDGIPQILWEQQGAPAVAAPRPLADAERWMFSRGHSEGQVRQGNVEVVNSDFGKAWWLFSAPWFAGLGERYRLTVKFDPADPSAGAAIFNREEGARAKVRSYLESNWPVTFGGRWTAGQRDAGLAPGELIGVAQLCPESPYFAKCKTREMEVLGRLAAEHEKFARIQCSILGPRGTRLAAYTEAHDGKGNSRKLETGEQRAVRNAARAAEADVIVAAAERVQALSGTPDAGHRTLAGNGQPIPTPCARGTPAAFPPPERGQSLSAALWGAEF